MSTMLIHGIDQIILTATYHLKSFMAISLIDHRLNQLQDCILTMLPHLEDLSLSIPIENSLWHPGIGIFNLNRTYIKKLKVARLPLILVYCSFSFLFLLLNYFSV